MNRLKEDRVMTILKKSLMDLNQRINCWVQFGENNDLS